MKCSKCGTENPKNHRFCCQCGSPLEQLHRCSCGAELPTEALFCPECGAKLPFNAKLFPECEAKVGEPAPNITKDLWTSVEIDGQNIELGKTTLTDALKMGFEIFTLGGVKKDGIKLFSEKDCIFNKISITNRDMVPKIWKFYGIDFSQPFTKVYEALSLQKFDMRMDGEKATGRKLFAKKRDSESFYLEFYFNSGAKCGSPNSMTEIVITTDRNNYYKCTKSITQSK